MGKRIMDIIIASFILIIFSPFLALLLIFLKMVTHEHPIFIQQRPGYQQRIFKLYKVKTMYREESQQLKKFCLFLRRYSLDELPQFFNVIIGDMSLVGPRPLLKEYLSLYNSIQSRRHEVRPGITGWAQINGRNAIPWPKRFALDIWYVDHLSFSLDIQILFRTVKSLFKTDNVREAGLLPHEKFLGNTVSSEIKVPEKLIN